MRGKHGGGQEGVRNSGGQGHRYERGGRTRQPYQGIQAALTNGWYLASKVA